MTKEILQTFNVDRTVDELLSPDKYPNLKKYDNGVFTFDYCSIRKGEFKAIRCPFERNIQTENEPPVGFTDYINAKCSECSYCNSTFSKFEKTIRGVAENEKYLSTKAEIYPQTTGDKVLKLVLTKVSPKKENIIRKVITVSQGNGTGLMAGSCYTSDFPVRYEGKKTDRR